MSPSRVGVFADDAPVLRPGVYTPAIIANGFVFTSGVLGADPVTKKMVDGTMVDRFVSTNVLSFVILLTLAQHQIMRNLKQILEKAGSGIEHVVEVSVFLTDIDDADSLSPAYVQYWGDLMPARTYVPG
jgi:enamine deaminase RidA (YjgF/YER057c/UK114 family)